MFFNILISLKSCSGKVLLKKTLLTQSTDVSYQKLPKVILMNEALNKSFKRYFSKQITQL